MPCDAEDVRVDSFLAQRRPHEVKQVPIDRSLTQGPVRDSLPERDSTVNPVLFQKRRAMSEIHSLQELPSDATPVSRSLADQGIHHRVFRHPAPLFSLEQAALERGQRPGQVVRSIVFRIAAGEFVMVLVAGPAQIAWPALRAYLGHSRLTTATEDELLAITGYTRGAVAPFALPVPMRILIDHAVLTEEEVSMGSGVQGTTIIMRSADLLNGLPGAELGAFSAAG